MGDFQALRPAAQPVRWVTSHKARQFVSRVSCVVSRVSIVSVAFASCDVF